MTGSKCLRYHLSHLESAYAGPLCRLRALGLENVLNFSRLQEPRWTRRSRKSAASSRSKQPGACLIFLVSRPKNAKVPSGLRKRDRPFPSIAKAAGKDGLDHAAAQGGDVVDLWAQAKGISVKQAILEILAQRPGPNRPVKAPSRPPETVLAPEGILWPENLCEPSEAECRALGVLRGLSPEAFFLAGQLGTLLMGDKRGQKRLWMTCDRAMRSAAMRRLDGKNLDLIDKKSASPKNAKRDWMIGTQTSNPELDALKTILVVEGEGDYYAALQLAINSEINFKVLAILGAATRTFAGECLAQFRGARVLIIPHNDRSLAGEKAAKRWSELFLASGAGDCLIQPLPIVVNDLNDFLIQRPLTGPQLLKGFHDGTTQGPRK